MEGISTAPGILDGGNYKMNFPKRQNIAYGNKEGHLTIDKRRRREVENADTVIHEYFNKKFSFENSDSWCLCNPDELFTSSAWEIPELQDMKQELNIVKNKLNDYVLEDWHRHTRNMNKAGNVQWKLKRDYEPEFVTQAWCKFYECVMSYPLVPLTIVGRCCFNSVHLCEAPGAFVTSLNHFLKSHFTDIEWQWLATTLNPYYESNSLGNMINDDRFILQTLSNWTFGEDSTGNLMDLNNMLHLSKVAEKLGDISLVTADGSIDCQENPGEQEGVVSQLHFCEIVSALHLLAEGGNFLLKIFTMYEAQTVCLMYLLCCVFRKVHVFKPATSKEGNSEVYVICLEYRRKLQLELWLSKLREHFGPDSPSCVMFPLDKIPQDFIQQVILCAGKFKSLQVDVIENNIKTFEEKTNQYFVIKHLKYLAADYFMNIYKLQKLSDESQEVVGKSKLKDTPTFNLEGRLERGSFSDRCRLKYLTPSEQLIALLGEVEDITLCWSFSDDIKWIEFPPMDITLRVVTGKPVAEVYCSKFCIGSLLRLHHQVKTTASEILRLISSASRSLCENLCCSYSTWNELSNIVTERCPDLAASMRILNFKEECHNIVRGNYEQKGDILKIMNILCTVKDGENLLLLQFPMLTQFNVGLVYLLSHLFRKVGFIKPVKQDFGVLFMGFSPAKTSTLNLFKDIYKVLENIEIENRKSSVISIIPMDQLCGKHLNLAVDKESEEANNTIMEPTFYQCVTEVNNLSVKENIFERISQLRGVL